MSTETLGGAVREGQIFLDLLKEGPCGSQQSIFGLSYLVKKKLAPALSLPPPHGVCVASACEDSLNLVLMKFM